MHRVANPSGQTGTSRNGKPTQATNSGLKRCFSVCWQELQRADRTWNAGVSATKRRLERERESLRDICGPPLSLQQPPFLSQLSWQPCLTRKSWRLGLRSRLGHAMRRLVALHGRFPHYGPTHLLAHPSTTTILDTHTCGALGLPGYTRRSRDLGTARCSIFASPAAFRALAFLASPRSWVPSLSLDVVVVQMTKAHNDNTLVPSPSSRSSMETTRYGTHTHVGAVLHPLKIPQSHFRGTTKTFTPSAQLRGGPSIVFKRTRRRRTMSPTPTFAPTCHFARRLRLPGGRLARRPWHDQRPASLLHLLGPIGRCGAALWPCCIPVHCRVTRFKSSEPGALRWDGESHVRLSQARSARLMRRMWWWGPGHP
uniref:Uncharacterized protein n=1 Tax=Mycena chlorophos TaxID=658473 RepID=A0ABQ0LQJ9_MYCCL|nr:predicted protein [Mycena chlorophos]